MAKEKQAKEEVVAEKSVMTMAPTEEIMITADTVIDVQSGEEMKITDLIKTLESKEQGMEVSSVYFEFPMGKPVKCFYVGDLTIKGQKGNEVPAVRLLLEDGSFAITASAVVVSTMKNYKKLKSFSITRTGEATGPNGNYYTYKIFELVD